MQTRKNFTQTFVVRGLLWSTLACGMSACFSPLSGSFVTSIKGTTVNTGSNPNSGNSGSANSGGSSSACAGLTVGNLGNLNGFLPYGVNSPWNVDISAWTPATNSQSLLTQYFGVGDHTGFHADYGGGGAYGIPYTVVDSSKTGLVNFTVKDYADESDVMYSPFTSTTAVEGSTQSCDGGDCHAIVIDKNTCYAYESWATAYQNGAWSAYSLTLWDLSAGQARPYEWTSADAAGLSVFAGLVKYEEAASGVINHAIRVTLNNTPGSFTPPATHQAQTSQTATFPLGTRFRLKSTFDVSGFSKIDQAILNAMKKYGLIVADNGSDLYFQGTNDPRWTDDDVEAFSSITWNGSLEVMPLTPVYSEDPTAPQYTGPVPTGASPVISSFSASSTSVTAGTSVTLSWATSGQTYNFIDKLGPQRGSSVSFVPKASGTYTLNSTNQYGRVTKAVTITVK